MNTTKYASMSRPRSIMGLEADMNWRACCWTIDRPHQTGFRAGFSAFEIPFFPQQNEPNFLKMDPNFSAQIQVITTRATVSFH